MSDLSGLFDPATQRTTELGQGDGTSFYDQVGGHPVFEKLVRRFYEGVRNDPVLWPMYPQDDLEGAIWRLSRFLEQYWGGPTDYSQKRGHPRLQLRHAAFKVNPEAKEHWLGHMRVALDELGLPPLQEETIWSYLDRAATSMVNTFEP
jgi:hemoglobin